MATPMPVQASAPRRVGDYEILTELATGGVATVFVARHVGDAGFERLVAIKRVHRHLLRDADVFASLADEARISALVRHPNVVATHEVLDQKGELCLVQEYVEGVSLALLHKRAMQRDAERLPVDVVARIAVDFLRGLHAAHEALDLRGAPLELVHRDVSPQNVIVGVDGVARLIDFGIARAEGRITETRGGILKGKLAYMAPEQVGERDVDRRADLFAAGVVLYELLAGGRPFDGVGDAEAMARILAADADLTKVASRSIELAPVVARALEKDPAARWSTAEDFAEAIAEARRPASDAVMRAYVKDVAGEIIEERRASVREALGRADEEALAMPSPASAAPSAAADDAPPPEDDAPRASGARRLPFAPMAVGIVAVAVVAALISTRDGTTTPAARASGTPTGEPTATLAPPASSPPSGAADPQLVPSDASGVAARAAHPRIVVPRASASSAASAAPSARPDLHANPYGN